MKKQNKVSKKKKSSPKVIPGLRPGGAVKRNAAPNQVRGAQKLVGGPMAMNLVGAYENYSYSLGREIQTTPFNLNGKTGMRLRGVVPIASVTTDGKQVSGDGCLNFFLGTGAGFKAIALHPTFIFPNNSQESDLALDYTRFRFSKLRLIYTTLTGSNQTRCIMLSFYGDGSIMTGTIPPMATTGLLPGASTIATWVPIRQAEFSKYLDTEDWFYMDIDGAGSDASNRQSFQGAVLGYWITPQAAALNDGTVWMEYELDLLESRPAVDVTLQRSKPELKIQKDFRPRPQRCIRRRDRIPGPEEEPLEAPAHVQEDSDLVEVPPPEQLTPSFSVLSRDVHISLKAESDRKERKSKK
jgi:hypothetical protein